MTDKIRVENVSGVPVWVPGGLLEPGKPASRPESEQLAELRRDGIVQMVEDDDQVDDMTGSELESALEARGLPKSGTNDEKRARLREAMSGSSDEEEE